MAWEPGTLFLVMGMGIDKRHVGQNYVLFYVLYNSIKSQLIKIDMTPPHPDFSDF